MPRTLEQILYDDDPKRSTHTKRLKRDLEAHDDGKFWMESLSSGLNAEFVGDQELMSYDLMQLNDEYKVLQTYIEKEAQEA